MSHIKFVSIHGNPNNTKHSIDFDNMRSTYFLSGLAATALGAAAPKVANQTEYEYVVIGSGAGGGAVA